MPAYYFVLQEKIPGVDATRLDKFALSKDSDKRNVRWHLAIDY
jgi:hypothetical protein